MFCFPSFLWLPVYSYRFEGTSSPTQVWLVYPFSLQMAEFHKFHWIDLHGWPFSDCWYGKKCPRGDNCTERCMKKPSPGEYKWVKKEYQGLIKENLLSSWKQKTLVFNMERIQRSRWRPCLHDTFGHGLLTFGLSHQLAMSRSAKPTTLWL